MNRCFVPVVLGALFVAGCRDEPGRPNGLLITLDTTRADVVGAFGGRAGVTPSIDALALESVAFENARTVTPLTLPSHASMLTGLHPPRHTVRVNSVRPLPTGAETLAERAGEAGYQTAAIVASIALDQAFGLARGFEVYEQPTAPMVQAERAYDELPASQITDQALAWLRGRDSERPFFLWVHYFDPHVPLAAPERFAERGSPYEAEVAFMDAEIGRLLDAFREQGLLDETLVAVVGDHGESNGDHGERTHGAFCFDSTLHVPFLLRHPAGRFGGERVETVVSVTDVFPTFVEGLGLGSGDDLDGRSLLRHEQLADVGAYFESHYGYLLYGWSPMAGWVTGDKKLVQAATPTLFDLARDPGETTDVLDEHPRSADALERSLRDLLARPPVPDDGEVVDPVLLERLQALGYTAGGEASVLAIDPFAPTDRPAPHSRAEELARFARAQALAGAGRRAEAVALFEPLVADNPRNASALFELGQLLALDPTGAEDARAIELLTRALALGRDWYGPHFFLAQAHRRQGSLAAAEQHLRRAIELNPKLYRAMGLLGVVLQEAGRTAEAQRWTQRAHELAAEDR